MKSLPITSKLLALVLAVALSGCVGRQIDKSVDKCFMFGGWPSWARSDEAGKFDCKPGKGEKDQGSKSEAKGQSA